MNQMTQLTPPGEASPEEVWNSERLRAFMACPQKYNLTYREEWTRSEDDPAESACRKWKAKADAVYEAIRIIVNAIIVNGSARHQSTARAATQTVAPPPEFTKTMTRQAWAMGQKLTANMVRAWGQLVAVPGFPARAEIQGTIAGRQFREPFDCIVRTKKKRIPGTLMEGGDLCLCIFKFVTPPTYALWDERKASPAESLQLRIVDLLLQNAPLIDKAWGDGQELIRHVALCYMNVSNMHATLGSRQPAGMTVRMIDRSELAGRREELAATIELAMLHQAMCADRALWPTRTRARIDRACAECDLHRLCRFGYHSGYVQSSRKMTKLLEASTTEAATSFW